MLWLRVVDSRLSLQTPRGESLPPPLILLLRPEPGPPTGLKLIYTPHCGALASPLEEVLSGTHPGWGWGKRETSLPDSLALVGGALISDTQVSPSEQRLWAGNRDFLMPTKMEGVEGPKQPLSLPL